MNYCGIRSEFGKKYRSEADIIMHVERTLLYFGKLKISHLTRKNNINSSFVYELVQRNIVRIEQENNIRWVTLV